MNKHQAMELIRASLREGAELRTIVARDCSTAIFEAAGLITMCLRAGGKLLLFGNGGSAADAQHLAAEFVGRFVRERAGLPAIALTTDSSILTAVGNDYGFDQIFGRQVQALGRPGDDCIDKHRQDSRMSHYNWTPFLSVDGGGTGKRQNGEGRFRPDVMAEFGTA